MLLTNDHVLIILLLGIEIKFYLKNYLLKLFSKEALIMNSNFAQIKKGVVKLSKLCIILIPS